jgi:hypothetical protein
LSALLGKKKDFFPQENFFMEEGQLYAKRRADDPHFLDLLELIASYMPVSV